MRRLSLFVLVGLLIGIALPVRAAEPVDTDATWWRPAASEPLGLR